MKMSQAILQIFGLIFNTEECKILRSIAIANLAFSTINTILTFTFSSKLSGKYSVGGMIFLTINKGGQEKHTGIKGGHSISHTTSFELSNPSSLISNEQSLKSDYLNQEMEKMDQTSSFLPFSRDITQIQIDIIINVSFEYRNVKFYATREIKFLSEYVHQKPHA